MVKLVLISSNQKKIDELVKLLSGFEVKVMKIEYPELKLDDPCEISKSVYGKYRGSHD